MPQSIEPLRAVRARHVSCGHEFSSVLTERNDLYTWGSGDSGRLGIGSSQTLFIPMCVPLLSQKRVVQVSLGSDHAGVVTGMPHSFSLSLSRCLIRTHRSSLLPLSHTKHTKHTNTLSTLCTHQAH